MVKKMNKIIVISACLCALCLQACSEESADAGDTPLSNLCTVDDNRCIDANTLQLCEIGALVREKCANGCANGACKEPTKCTPADNGCKDEKTLQICDEASGVMKERECANGCAGNACASGACADDDNRCIDANTLQLCENGALVREKCANGCANGACKEPTKCTPADNGCKDEKTLQICDEASGVMKERECANGCAGNACASGACADDDNRCIDANTLQLCENGALVREKCANGCANGACKEPTKCTPADNGCKDEKTLQICDEASGVMKERECANGCAGNACASGACTDADNKCIDDSTAQICENGELNAISCAGGCKNGICRSLAEGEVCNTDDFEAFCLDAINLYASCASEFGSNYGKITYEKCPTDSSCLTSANKKYAGCYGDGKEICSAVMKAPYACKAGIINGNAHDNVEYSEQCLKMSDGSVRKINESTLAVCRAGCENTKCASENANNGQSCSAGMLQYCRNNGFENCGIADGEATCYANTCAKEGSSCATDPVTGKSVTKHCVMTDDGSRVIRIEEKCDLACASDGKSCMISAGSNATCSAEATAFCQNNGGLPCALHEGHAVCYGDGDKCNPENGEETRKYCEDNSIVTDICSFSDDGQTLLWKRYDSVGCGNNRCDPLAVACSSNICNDRFRKYCKVSSGDTGCAVYEGAAYCTHEDVNCSSATVGQSLRICTGETTFDGTTVLMRYQCIKAKYTDESGNTSNKYVWAKIDAEDPYTCPNSCSSNKCSGYGSNCNAEKSAFCARSGYSCDTSFKISGYTFDGFRGCMKYKSDPWCKNSTRYIPDTKSEEYNNAIKQSSILTKLYEWLNISGSVTIGGWCKYGCHPDGYCMSDARVIKKCADNSSYYEWDVEAEEYSETAKSCDSAMPYCYDGECVDYACGDGIVQGNEQCDAGPFDDDESEESKLEKARGIGCNLNCKTESYCGNGIIEDGEKCDDGAKNGTDESSCTSSCAIK